MIQPARILGQGEGEGGWWREGGGGGGYRGGEEPVHCRFIFFERYCTQT